MPWALEAQQLLGEEWGVDADVWSVTSWNELRRDAVECEEHSLLHPGEERAGAVRDADAGRHAAGRSSRCRTSCARCPTRSPAGCPSDYISLGTDGFGFADTRGAARRYFHVDAQSIVVAVLEQLAAQRRGQGGGAARGVRALPARLGRRRPASGTIGGDA